MSLRRRRIKREYNRKIETLLLRVVLFGLSLLVIFQFIMLREPVRKSLNYAIMLEGDSLREEGVLMREGYVYLTLEKDIPLFEVKLLLNGEPVANLDAYKTKVSVRHNDVLELDASKGTKGYYACVRIVDVSDNVIQPMAGLQIRAGNKIMLISRVTLR